MFMPESASGNPAPPHGAHKNPYQSTCFNDPVVFEPSQVHTQKLINVMKRRGTHHYKYHQRKSTYQCTQGRRVSTSGQRNKHCQQGHAQNARACNKCLLDLRTIFVPPLTVGHDAADFGQGALQVKLFVESQDDQAHQ